jgi:AcrR family transcriptional regulator
MPESAPARRTQADRRRDAERTLLAAAADAIAERGIGGASFAVIGQRAGTSRALPTHHFGSKDALVARVAAMVQDAVRVAMDESVRSRGLLPVSGLDLIRTAADTYLELFEHPSAGLRALLVMWGATFPSNASIEGMREAERRAYDGWAGNIRDGQGDGSIRGDVDPAATAVVLHGMLRGVAAAVLTESEDTDVARVRAAVQQWISWALAPPPTAS